MNEDWEVTIFAESALDEGRALVSKENPRFHRYALIYTNLDRVGLGCGPIECIQADPN